MKPQETKFTFVYNEIKQSILEGQILPGNALPSSRMYCDQFHVSRYTINRVFDALRAEGLVDIQPRLAPIVVSKKDTCNSSNTVFEILKQREGILQVYQTFALILPSLMVFSLQGCDVEIMPHYKQAMKVLRLGYSSGGWDAPSKLVYDILKIGGNSLFSELYSTFGLYNKLAFFAENCPYFSEYFLQRTASVTSVIIDTLKGNDPLTKYNRLSHMYQELTDSIEKTLNYLLETTPECPVQTGLKFSWNPMRGQDYYCLLYTSGQDNCQIKNTLELLFRELKEQKTGYTVYVETLLRQLIVQMIRNYQGGKKALHHFKPATPAEAQDFIIEESFLYDYPVLTLEQLAERLGLGCRQTERLMQDIYGKTFLQKKGDARMSAASILLTYSDRSISSIAEELGYSSVEHFSAAFRKYYNKSARQYRKESRDMT